jgi:hypothetical protein
MKLAPLLLSFCAVLITSGLSGCATTEPRVVYRDVKVLVSVPCKVTLPDEPEYATKGLTLDEPLFDLVRAVLVELEQRKARDVEVTAAAKSCS